MQRWPTLLQSCCDAAALRSRKETEPYVVLYLYLLQPVSPFNFGFNYNEISRESAENGENLGHPDRIPVVFASEIEKSNLTVSSRVEIVKINLKNQ